MFNKEGCLTSHYSKLLVNPIYYILEPLKDIGNNVFTIIKYLSITCYAHRTKRYKHPITCSLLVWFGLVWSYGILTIKGYLMLNSFYIYVLNIYDLLTHFVDNIFK